MRFTLCTFVVLSTLSVFSAALPVPANSPARGSNGRGGAAGAATANTGAVQGNSKGTTAKGGAAGTTTTTTASGNCNALQAGINSNIAVQQQEQSTIKNMQSLLAAGNTASYMAQKSVLLGLISKSVSIRTANQKLAAGNSVVTAGLAKVATAQATAKSLTSSLTGGAGDSSTLATELTNFGNGIATNQANLAAAKC